MNAFERARASINAIPALLRRSAEARRQTQQLITKPRLQLLITGSEPVQVINSETGECLGFRQSYLEAEQLAKHIESGHPLEA